METNRSMEEYFQQNYNSCQIEDHKKFIPVEDFDTKHEQFPAEFDKNNLLPCVKALSDITVRIVIGRVSSKRPDLRPCSTAQFALSDKKGQEYIFSGTGWVSDVITLSPETLSPEHLAACIEITTAAHVVYDEEEGEETACSFFCDSVSSISAEPNKIQILQKANEVERDEIEDISKVLFNCDLDLATKIKPRQEDFKKYYTNLNQSVNFTMEPAIKQSTFKQSSLKEFGNNMKIFLSVIKINSNRIEQRLNDTLNLSFDANSLLNNISKSLFDPCQGTNANNELNNSVKNLITRAKQGPLVKAFTLDESEMNKITELKKTLEKIQQQFPENAKPEHDRNKLTCECEELYKTYQEKIEKFITNFKTTQLEADALLRKTILDFYLNLLSNVDHSELNKSPSVKTVIIHDSFKLNESLVDDVIAIMNDDIEAAKSLLFKDITTIMNLLKELKGQIDKMLGEKDTNINLNEQLYIFRYDRVTLRNFLIMHRCCATKSVQLSREWLGEKMKATSITWTEKKNSSSDDVKECSEKEDLTFEKNLQISIVATRQRCIENAISRTHNLVKDLLELRDNQLSVFERNKYVLLDSLLTTIDWCVKSIINWIKNPNKSFQGVPVDILENKQKQIINGNIPKNDETSRKKNKSEGKQLLKYEGNNPTMQNIEEEKCIKCDNSNTLPNPSVNSRKSPSVDTLGNNFPSCGNKENYQIGLAEALNKKMEDQVPEQTLQDRRPYVIIASHPHGYSKQMISIGRCISKHVVTNPVLNDTQRAIFTYTAATCVGSSGAYVLVLGGSEKQFYHLVHSGSNENFKYSSYGQIMSKSD